MERKGPATAGQNRVSYSEPLHECRGCQSASALARLRRYPLRIVETMRASDFYNPLESKSGHNPAPHKFLHFRHAAESKESTAYRYRQIANPLSNFPHAADPVSVFPGRADNRSPSRSKMAASCEIRQTKGSRQTMSREAASE